MNRLSAPTPESNEVLAILNSVVLNDVKEAELNRLNDLLIKDALSRRLAAQFLEEESFLRRQFQVLGKVGDFHDLPVETRNLPAKLIEIIPAKKSHSWTALAVAASLLVCTLFIVSIQELSLSSKDHSPKPNNKVLAMITSESQNSEWTLDNVESTPKKTIRQGDMIRVAQGKVKLSYTNGVELTLHGPALYELLSDMRGRTHLGRLTARISEGAEGFSVLTPRATVVDLGTEFGIEVDGAGSTDVVVFEGSVDLHYKSQVGGASKLKRLVTGEAMRLEAYGTVSRIVAITDQRFSDDPSANEDALSRPMIISSVRDNIQREAAWNYYEIVHAGMREDARAFVDRQAHEWNGLDEEGLPAYLIGGDYVKTFNNDKCRKDVEIIINLETPCNLYVLFDERIPPPNWLVSNFENTGDKIGIDGGPWVYNGVASEGVNAAVGSGKSIDDEMSIWVRRISKPGPVKLGATETPHDDLNMYGIVAVPLQDEVSF